MHNTWAERKRRASERGRQMAMARWSRRVPNKQIDADTLRHRALDDRRGSLFAEVKVPTEAGPLIVTATWSTAGRVDQVDLWAEGKHIGTRAPRAIFDLIAQHLGGAKTL